MMYREVPMQRLRRQPPCLPGAGQTICSRHTYDSARGSSHEWKWLSEFREFALKGNVVDLAVGVIIGAAFGKIVSALVENVLMPPIGFLLKGVDFKDLAINMGPRRRRCSSSTACSCRP